MSHSRLLFSIFLAACILLPLSFFLYRQSYNNSQDDWGNPTDTTATASSDEGKGNTQPMNESDAALSQSSNLAGSDSLSGIEICRDQNANGNSDTRSDEYSDAHADTRADSQKQLPPEERREEMTAHPDRVTYCEGFFFEPLTDEIINRIQGVSYHENPDITYDDLRYLNVLYYDFTGQTQIGEIICNRQIAQDLLEIFKTLYDASYQIEKIKLIDEYAADDDLSCADNNTSCFNYRTVAGSETLSKHALGMAIDINPFYNPYITYPDGKKRISPAGSEKYEDREGGYDHMILKDDLCYRLFIEHGFTWGGEWKSIKDYQHFQKVIAP